MTLPRTHQYGCASSMEYLLLSNAKFDYEVYYQNFCQGFSRSQTKAKLLKDLEACVFDIRSTLQSDTKTWLDEQVKNGLPLEKTAAVNAFWFAQEEQKNVVMAATMEATRKALYVEKMHSTIMEKQDSPTLTTNAKEYQCQNAVMELDTILLFNGKSLASILKTEGQRLFQEYDKLDALHKNLCSYCLNGILDISSTSLQKQLFTENEWSYIQDYFKEKDRLPRLSKDVKERIFGLVKLTASGQFLKTYNRCLKHVTKVPTDDTWLFKALAHVLNCYNERTEIFQSSFNSTTTECNYMAKLWYEVFELIFGTTQLHPKWGESVPDATTAIKLVNNNNKSHTIGCKIDGRVLYKDNQSIDFCHMEASKMECTESKVQKDKVKLAIETKCSLDSIISKSTQPTLKKSIALPNLVISGIEAQANSLALVDYGLYVSSEMFDLSLPDNMAQFGEEMTTWCRKLKLLRSMCLKNSAICTALLSPPRKRNLAQETPDNMQGTDVKDWVRGTFTIPTTGPALFPKHFLTSPIASSNTAKPKATTDFVVSILSDGTKVKRRVKLQDCNKKKRKSRRTVDDNPGHKRKRKHQSHNAANANHHPRKQCIH